MADNLTTQTTVSTVPSGSVIATDDVAGTHYQKVKLVDGTADSSAAIAGDAANGLDVDVTRVQGTVAVTQSGTWDEVGINDSGNSITVDDGGASLTVDGTVTVTEPVSVDDNGGSLTVDGTVTAQTSTTSSITTLDSLDDAVTVATAGAAEILFIFVTDGNLAGTLAMEVSFDNAASWVSFAGFYEEDSVSLVSSIDGGHGYIGNWLAAGTHFGFSHARMRVSAYTSGSVNAIAQTRFVAQGWGPNTNHVRLTSRTGTDNVADVSALGDTESSATSTLRVGSRPQVFNGTTWDRLRGDITNGVDVDVTRLPALAAGTANIGDVDVLTVPSPLSTAGNGTAATAHRVTIASDSTGQVAVASIAAGDNNIGNVDVVTMPNVTLAAGTNTNEVVGDVAHDVAAAGNPLLNAGISQDMDDTAPPNQVAAESRATRIATDRDGAIFVRPFGPRIWSYHENSSSALTDTTVHAAPAAGLSLYVTDIVVSTGAATAFNIFFEEGASTVLGPYYLEAVSGRGLALHFMTPKKITAATALTVTTSAAIAHSIDVTGFTAQG